MSRLKFTDLALSDSENKSIFRLVKPTIDRFNFRNALNRITRPNFFTGEELLALSGVPQANSRSIYYKTRASIIKKTFMYFHDVFESSSENNITPGIRFSKQCLFFKLDGVNFKMVFAPAYNLRNNTYTILVNREFYLKEEAFVKALRTKCPELASFTDLYIIDDVEKILSYDIIDKEKSTLSVSLPIDPEERRTFLFQLQKQLAR